jgi:hypothetical protein
MQTRLEEAEPRVLLGSPHELVRVNGRGRLGRRVGRVLGPDLHIETPSRRQVRGHPKPANSGGEQLRDDVQCLTKEGAYHVRGPTESGYKSGHGRALSAVMVRQPDTGEEGQFWSEGT